MHSSAKQNLIKLPFPRKKTASCLKVIYPPSSQNLFDPRYASSDEREAGKAAVVRKKCSNYNGRGMPAAAGARTHLMWMRTGILISNTAIVAQQVIPHKH